MSNNKNILKTILNKAIVALAACVAFCFTCCTEDIDQSNRYTFTGETVVDYLENRSETFSNFLYILDNAYIGKTTAETDFSKVATARNLLSTYGQYTCFAPTNTAIENYLKQQYEKWVADMEALKDGSLQLKDFRDTGVHSPILEDLSDSMCSEIVKNHVLERSYMTVDLSEGSFPSPNMNDRFITMTYMVNDTTGAVYPLLNYNSKIIVADQKVENGIVQTVDAVLNPSTALLPDLLMSQTKYFSIWAKILEMTELDTVMRHVEDKKYAASDVAGAASTSYYAKANTQHKVYYPTARKFKYTMLIEPDSIFIENGINDEWKLIDECYKWYGTEDKDSFSSPNNALYKFVAYHILDRQLQYASGTGPGGFIMENYKNHYDSEAMMYGSTFDRSDYFDTKLPYTMIKATRPLTSPDYNTDLVINYAQNGGKKVYNQEMRKHLNVIVYSPNTILEYMPDFKDDALNGRLHPINRILVYNDGEMAGNVLNERMRWDFSSWFSELTNNNIRWFDYTSTLDVFHIPDGYLERARFRSTNSDNFYLSGRNGWYNYQGDEMLASAAFDIEYRMPSVPSGTYELRFGYSRYPNRSVVQFYIDGKPTGIPVDLRSSTETDAFINSIPDHEFDGDEQAIAANDKEMHNRNWMKAPASFKVANGTEARQSEKPMRYVLGMFTLTQGEHWFRMKNVRDDGDMSTQGQHDYFEIVPKSVISDPTKPEDRY